MASITRDHRVDDADLVTAGGSPARGRRPELPLAASSTPRSKRAILIIGIWTALGVFQSVPELMQGFSWNVFLAKMIEAWSWAILTPAILLINKRIANLESNIPLLGAVLLVLSIIFSLVHMVITGILLFVLPGVWWNPLRVTPYITYYFLGG